MVAATASRTRHPGGFSESVRPGLRNSRGLRLVDVDTGWRHGDTGPTVAGRAAELISVLGNRPKMLPHLEGDGVEALADRVLSRPSRTAG